MTDKIYNDRDSGYIINGVFVPLFDEPKLNELLRELAQKQNDSQFVKVNRDLSIETPIFDWLK